MRGAGGTPGLIFYAPVWWMGLPAIHEGWLERVFADTFTAEGWAGQLEGPVSLTGRPGMLAP